MGRHVATMSASEEQCSPVRAASKNERRVRKHLSTVVVSSFVALSCLGAPGPAVETGGQADEVRFDFETGDLQQWRVVEGWFENPVSDRETFHNVY